jgi:hypothetical protein
LLRVSPQAKKLIPLTIGFLVIIAIAAVAVIHFARESVGAGQRCSGNLCWGYSLDEYDFQNRAQLRFWGTWGLDLRYTLPNMNIEKVTDDAWLGDRAIYLNLTFKPKNDSASEGSRVRVVYDFQRGELYLNSPLQLWRAPDYRSNNPGVNWMTESQFDAELAALAPE